MAIKTINDEHLYAIGNAIRSKNGTEETYKPSEMAAAIEAIKGSSDDLIYTGVFEGSGALRTAETTVMNHFKPAPAFNYNGNIYYKMFNNCYCLNKIENIPVIQDTCNENRFIDTFNNCYMASELTFETQSDGSGIPVNWSGQIIRTGDYVSGISSGGGITYELDWALGTCGMNSYDNNEEAILNSGAGITTTYRVSEDDSYSTYSQKLRDGGSNWYSVCLYYSKYKKHNIVRTIKSLPDASRYLANTGAGLPTNTLVITHGTGAWTADDGDPTYYLTDAEIAIATEKGWTITFTGIT